MEELFNQKYDTDKFDEDTYLREQYKHKGYGIIYIKNPDFPMDDDQEYLIRKPTLKERREIIINTVIECNGRTFKVHALAQKLTVSDRTVQTILRQLQKDGLIQITPRHNKDGKQKERANGKMLGASPSGSAAGACRSRSFLPFRSFCSLGCVLVSAARSADACFKTGTHLTTIFVLDIWEKLFLQLLTLFF